MASYSLNKSCANGSSRFAIVVCSEAFFANGWPQYELDGLVTRTVAGQQNLLPIWHGVTRDDVMIQSPSLADKVALSTTSKTNRRDR